MRITKESLKQIIKEELEEAIEDDDHASHGLTYAQINKMDKEDALAAKQASAASAERSSMQASKEVASIYKAIRDDVAQKVLERAMKFKKFASLLGKKPATRGNMIALINKAIESVGQISVAGRNARDFQDFIKLATMAEIKDSLPSASRSEKTIAVAKEIKTEEGKEMIAAAIYPLLQRATKPFVKANQSFLQRMNPFNENKGMKVTEEQLKQIIKEELEDIMDENRDKHGDDVYGDLRDRFLKRKKKEDEEEEKSEKDEAGED